MENSKLVKYEELLLSAIIIAFVFYLVGLYIGGTKLSNGNCSSIDQVNVCTNQDVGKKVIKIDGDSEDALASVKETIDTIEVAKSFSDFFNIIEGKVLSVSGRSVKLEYYVGEKMTSKTYDIPKEIIIEKKKDKEPGKYDKEVNDYNEKYGDILEAENVEYEKVKSYSENMPLPYVIEKLNIGDLKIGDRLRIEVNDVSGKLEVRSVEYILPLTNEFDAPTSIDIDLESEDIAERTIRDDDIDKGATIKDLSVPPKGQ